MEGYRWKAAVITLSDKGYAGEREDKSGPLLCEMITEAGYEVKETILLPDEQKEIEKCLCKLCDTDKVDVIFTTGGTGFSPRDCTPEATMAVAERNVPGIAEAMRMASMQVTPRAMLSRGVSVIRGKTLIVNLPGSPKAVRENLEVILPALDHGLAILSGRDGECAR
ncbi:MAG TPA: MogA/MoaB family molybdenum cofactor biosynthesis protein [Candidatus Mediterraneibacter intestinigallinarum]|nr:MogA/MoaB family molybdenum cofactor biosynthesis protein [Candidatus Mediterraneibacter intestinigallinarum]